jgi:predicted nucleic acid-binding protein
VKTAVDTNVFSALWSGEPTASQMTMLLGQSRNLGAVVVCGAVYAELLAHPKATQGFVDAFLANTGVSVEFDVDEAIWRDAARGFVAYAQRRRASSGTQAKRLLVDFVVGAHASLNADRLLSLDPTRYAQDFPNLTVLP